LIQSGLDLIARFGTVQLAALGKQSCHGLFLGLAVGIQLAKRVDFIAGQKFHLPDALVQIADVLPHSITGALGLAWQRAQFVQIPIIQSPQSGELAGFAVGPAQAAVPDTWLLLSRWIPPSRIQDSAADSLRDVSLA